MPSSTSPATPGPSNTSKRAISDPDSPQQDCKKPRRNPSADSTVRLVSNRDTRRRKRKKKKTPVVSAAPPKETFAPDEPSRPPPVARNQLIRFTSPLPQLDRQASATPDPDRSAHTPGSPPTSDTSQHSSSEVMLPPTLKDEQPADPSISEPPSCSLEDKVAKLEAELKSKDDLIASHHALLAQVHPAVTCQVCLDLMYKPYALAPCGHLACYSCLVNWFTAPPPDNRPAPPAIRRRKTCPHCRAVVRERPAEVWGVKNIAQALGKSGLLSNQLPVPAHSPDSLSANADPWKDIFFKPGATSRTFPWFFPGADIDDDDVHIADGAPRGEDVGMLDMEDGGIYRCLDCMHEIWDGVCTSCGRIYPGHRPGPDDEDFEENPMGWLEDQMVAEEVDVADDPGWVGLEGGQADDDGGDPDGDDLDIWHPFSPMRRPFNMFHGPWGYFGAIHVDEEDDEEDMYDRIHVLRVPDRDEESADEDYESSFIDDEDEEGGIDYFDGPRFQEIGDVDEDGEYCSHERRGTFDDVSSDDELRDGFDVTERATTGRQCAYAAALSSEEAGDPGTSPGPRRHPRRGRVHGIVQSDDSDAYCSD